MKYDLFGKTFDTSTTMGRIALYQEQMYNPTTASSNARLANVQRYLQAQREVDAEDRYERETDPKKKRIMEKLMSQGLTNFDLYFGPEK